MTFDGVLHGGTAILLAIVAYFVRAIVVEVRLLRQHIGYPGADDPPLSERVAVMEQRWRMANGAAAAKSGA